MTSGVDRPCFFNVRDTRAFPQTARFGRAFHCVVNGLTKEENVMEAVAVTRQQRQKLMSADAKFMGYWRSSSRQPHRDVQMPDRFLLPDICWDLPWARTTR